jgi:uncharacterized protein YkwD
MRKTVATLLSALFLTTMSAQSPCPTSSAEGIHVVKFGETLFSISKKYNTTVAQLREWNNMAETDILQTCTELKVASNVLVVTAQSTPKDVPTGYNLPIVSSKDMTEFTESEASLDEYQGNYTGTPNYTYFEKSAYLPFYYIVAIANETPTSIGRQYGLSGSDVMMMNNLTQNAPLAVGKKLMLEDRSQMRNGTYTFEKSNRPAPIAKKFVPVPQSYNTPAKKTAQVPWSDDAEVGSKSVSAPKSKTSDKAKTATPVTGSTTMIPEEMDMVQEINLVRTNPEGYIPYIEEYIAHLQKTGDLGGSIATAHELIAELKRTPRLSVLKPLQCIYTAAKKHGEEQKRRGDTDHQGIDGSWPWDRVKRECPDLQDGNENLVGGPASVRRAVILLLVDHGIDSRGHRKTMLNPDWQYVACYKVGTVGNMPNCWVQNYGY